MKLLCHLTPHPERERELRERAGSAAAALRGREGVEALAMLRIAQDPFGRRTGFGATLEVRSERLDCLEESVATLRQQLGEAVDLATSTLLVGEDIVFVASEHAPIRYQYLMRRNADFTHASYLERYRDVHSAFGVRTPGILGYVQFHVDDTASERLAKNAGFGVWDIDSVSELHLASVDTFLAAVARSSIGAEAKADEDKFVDRANSLDFCSEVAWPGL